MSRPTSLQLNDLRAFYGASPVLHGVNLAVARGEIVALLGRNGAGRSTVLRAVMGLVDDCRGSVRWGGRELVGLRPFEIARAGIGYVPEGREVFPRLSVRDNLALGRKPGTGREPGAPSWTLDDVHRLFPRLREREHVPAGQLSGGEQQMLALARTLMGQPQLLLVDEPTEGLAPQVVALVSQALRALRERGLGVLLVEQKLAIALDIADRCLVMGHGRIVFEGTPAALRADAQVQREWLEV